DMRLHGCELIPSAAPADERYLGKTLEIVGYVTAFFPMRDDREYPLLRLEHDTNGHVDIECVFPKADEAELRKVQPVRRVTLSAVCSGRNSPVPDRYLVRFDNCRLIYTTAPVPPMRRLDAAQVVRDYEEDLRTALLPAMDMPPVARLGIAELEKEFLDDRNTPARKYSNRILAVTGSLSAQTPQVFVLESGNTAH